MDRRQFLAATAGAAVAVAAPTHRPNIVWIMADDLGYSDVSCYGQKFFQTPNIDRLAAEGMRFTDAYSGCTVCGPSRSVLMTGLHGGHTSIRSNPGGVGLLASDYTVAQMLKSAGYATGGFGKWGLGDIGTDGVPSKHGFDEFFGYLHQVHAHDYYTPYLIDNEKKFPLEGNENGKHTTYSHDVIAARAEGFLRRHKSDTFFCYLPYTLPHLALEVPDDSLDRFRDKFPESQVWSKPLHGYPSQQYPRATYAGMVTRLDRTVRRVMALLRELAIDDNTIVFFTSDNGGAPVQWRDDYFHSNGPLRAGKGSEYEGGIRIPMIARWPGRIRAGATSNLPWYFPDFFPTAAELSGGKLPRGLDGLSVLPTLLGRGGQQRHEFMYWEEPRYDEKTGEFLKGKPPQAVRMGDWKAVRPQPDAPLELYNLKIDIGERTNVAAENPKVMARIEEYLKYARTEPRTQEEPTGGYHVNYAHL